MWCFQTVWANARRQMKERGKQTNYWKNGTKMADIWQTVMKSSELELNQSAPAGGGIV